MDQHSVSSILTDDEVTALAFALGKGQKEFLTEDVKIVVEWARRNFIEIGFARRSFVWKNQFANR